MCSRVLTPKISVIVPIFNSEKWLKRCIDSILAQKYTDFELILINDGSTDSSPRICDEYALMDSRIKVIHKCNGGVSSARNLGIDTAEGEWITFCDSDDRVYDSWLNNFAEYFEYGFDMIIQGFESDNKLMPWINSTKYGSDFELYKTAALIKLYDLRIVGYTVVKAFRRDIIEKYRIRFDENVRFKEDEIFVVNYFQYIHIIKSVSKPGYFYYVPDFESKYCKQMNIDDLIYQCKTLHSLFSNFDGIESYRFYQSPLGFLSDAYIEKMIGCDKRNWNKYITEIRSLIKSNFISHPMHFRLKSFIAHNQFNWLSFVVLYLYYISRKALK